METIHTVCSICGQAFIILYKPFEVGTEILKCFNCNQALGRLEQTNIEPSLFKLPVRLHLGVRE